MHHQINFFDRKQLVATEELMTAVRMLKDVKDPEKLARIATVLSKLDDDSEGKIELDDLVKVRFPFYFKCEKNSNRHDVDAVVCFCRYLMWLDVST